MIPSYEEFKRGELIESRQSDFRGKEVSLQDLIEFYESGGDEDVRLNYGYSDKMAARLKYYQQNESDLLKRAFDISLQTSKRMGASEEQMDQLRELGKKIAKSEVTYSVDKLWWGDMSRELSLSMEIGDLSSEIHKLSRYLVDAKIPMPAKVGGGSLKFSFGLAFGYPHCHVQFPSKR